MVREEELKEPVVFYLWDFYKEIFDEEDKLLVYEEPTIAESLCRPDLIFICSPSNTSNKDCIVTVVEIENHIRTIEDDPSHGVYQLRNCPGNFKYLAIPKTIYRLDERYIESACSKRGYGLLVVDLDTDLVDEVVCPVFKEDKDISAYSAAFERWKALKKSNDRFRWIEGNKICESE